MKNILVLGGSGFLGQSVCELLSVRRADGRIVVPTRRPQHANRVRSLPTVEAVTANVHDDAALARLLAGCDAVINLVAILHGSAAEFEHVHVALPRRLAQACQAAGVRRVLHVSALGVGPDAPSNYLRSKTAGEAVLQQSGLALTLFRPSVMFGADDKFLNVFAGLQALAPVVPLAGSHARFQPVWVEDVARGIVAALDRPETVGKTYECTGPTTYSLSGLVYLAGRWSGHERPQLPLPAALGRLQALAMEWLPGPTLMSRDNLDSMRVPNVATGTLPGLDALGVVPVSMEAIAPDYLGGRFGRARLNRWRAGRG
jgi:NADH dehydrogenase